MVDRLLDFFESAPLLNTIHILDSIPNSSDAPPERIVPLHHLNALTITADRVLSLLNHLCIPTGTSLWLWTVFSGQASPLLDYLPETSPNIRNLSLITAVNLGFYPENKGVQLIGPGRSLSLYARWKNRTVPSSTMDNIILRSLGPRILSTTQLLTILRYIHGHPASTDNHPVFQTLSSINDLQTLTLSRCENQSFVLALNPDKNRSKLLLCPTSRSSFLMPSCGVTPKT